MARLLSKFLSLAVCLMGLCVMIGWLFNQEALKNFNLDLTVMVFNTALCFTVVGIAMLVPESYPSLKKYVLFIAGYFLLIFCGLVAAQDMTGHGLGIDQLFAHVKITDDNPDAGRMAPLTTICFILCSPLIVLLSRPRRRWENILFQITVLIVLFLSITGVAAASARLDLLYDWYEYGRMSLPTALTFLVLTGAVWISWYHQEAREGAYLAREDKRIGVTGILILAVVSLAAGLSGFSILAHQMEQILEASLRNTFNNHAELVQDTINTALADAEPITTRLLLNRALIAFNNNPNDAAAQSLIKEDAATFLGPGFSGVTIYSLSGQPVAQAGAFTESPSLSIPLILQSQDKQAQLLWKDGAALQIKMDILSGNKKIGAVLTERKLTPLENLLLDKDSLGDSAETRICFALNDNQMGCLPSLRRSAVTMAAPRINDGNVTSMDFALRGQNGVRLSRDYLKHQVITVYGPIGNLGLGMVVKIDTAEFYGPLREKLQYVVVLLLLLSGFGIFLQRTQLVPLVARLVKSEQRIKTIMANVLDLIITVNEDGIIESVNSAIFDMFGYAEAQVSGQNVSLLLPEALVFMHNNLSAKSCELVARHADGHAFTVFMTVSEMYLGEKRYFVSSVRDVTEQKKQQQALETSEETFRSAMENASSGMSIVSPDGRWLKVNDALCTMLGYERSEFLRVSFREMTHPDDVQKDIAHIEKLKKGEILHYKTEKRYVHKNGKFVWALLSVSIVRNSDGSPNYLIGHMHDITARKEMERMKEEFISTVSHELRTPLTSIRGSLGLIEGTMAKDLPPTVNQLINIAHKNSERLILLINDILDIDKIDSGQMRFDLKDQPLAPLLLQAVEANRGYADKFGVTIDCAAVSPDLTITLDANRLMQALSNLLSNAAKFSKKNDVIRVYVVAQDGAVRICVQDTGSGIPDDFRSRIFNKFLQVDSSASRAQGGTGLGLHITKKIVEQMKGEIGFDTSPGQGSTFWLQFKDTRAAAHSRFSSNSVTPGQGNCILICEDDPDIICILKMQIELAGFTTDTATSIAEAREKLKNSHYAAMTLDLTFPSENGLDFIRELRRHSTTADLPIVVISATANEGKQILNGGAFGVIDWLTKPFDEVHLINALRRAAAVKGNSKPTVLHIEDDEDLSKMLATALASHAQLINAQTLREAKEQLLSNDFTLMILDIGLPDGNGLVLLKNMTDYTRRPIPVLILSAEEMPQSVKESVAVAMVKSRMSETKIIETILSLLHTNGSDNEQRVKAHPVH